jgi:hypothetical protein
MAAPYVHPRLAAVAHRYTNPDGSPVGPRVNVFIHGKLRPEGAGLIREPGDVISDRRFEVFAAERGRLASGGTGNTATASGRTEFDG